MIEFGHICMSHDQTNGEDVLDFSIQFQGLQLCACLFTARSVPASVNPRPFAPTASQKRATVALQEMDLMTMRRAEVTGEKRPGQQAASAAPKPNPKKGGGKGLKKTKQPKQGVKKRND